MTLPERPSIEWLRGAAKDLLRGLRAGDAGATARLEAGLPGIVHPTLAYAQTVIARENGFASWAALKTAVTARSVRRAKPPSKRAVIAGVILEQLIADATAGDPKVMADRPGFARAFALMVRDALEARPADRTVVIATLLKGLSHSNPRVRFECAHALDIYGDVSCRAPLAALIDDPIPRVRWMAMHALSCDVCKDDLFGDDDEVRRRIAERALNDSSVQVRRHAVWAVGVAGGDVAAETLRAVLARETDAAVLRNAHAVLRKHHPRAAAD